MSEFATVARPARAAENETRGERNSALQRMFDGSAGVAQLTALGETLQRRSAGLVVQRRLMIERGYYADRFRKPENRFKNQVLRNLNQLLNGTGATVSEADGEVTMTGRTQENRDDPRVRLLHDVITNDRTVTIRQTTEAKNRTETPQGTDPTAGAIAAATTGSDADVYFDPASMQMVDVWNADENRLQREPMPHFLILAHELIHAGRTQRGEGAFHPETGERLETAYRGGAGRAELGALEEVQTVGLDPLTAEELEDAIGEGGNLEGAEKREKFRDLFRTQDDLEGEDEDEEPVTENSLRGALGMRRRARYLNTRPVGLVPRRLEGSGALLDRLSGATRRRGVNWKAVAKVAIPALLAAGAVYAIPYLFGGGAAQRRVAPVRGTVQRRVAPRGVVQRFGIRSRTWNDVTTVEILRDGVYKVSSGSGESLIIKTSADVEDPGLEAAGAHVGVMLGVRTVIPEVLPKDSPEMVGAAAHFDQLGPAGQYVAASIRSSPTGRILVMPFIAGKQLKDARADWATANDDTRNRWMRELGRVFVLDLVIQNPDRHAENLMVGNDNEIHAIDQVVGPGARAEWGGEKIAGMLADAGRAKANFLRKLQSEMEFEDLDRYTAAFDEGVAGARAYLESLTAKPIEKTVQALTQSEHEVELSGLRAALPIIKAALR